VKKSREERGEERKKGNGRLVVTDVFSLFF
jgi:hypothetical protein